MANKPPRVYDLGPVELKRALHYAVLQSGVRLPPRGYVNAEVTFDEETDRIIGAKVWFTLKAPEGDDPKLAVKV